MHPSMIASLMQVTSTLLYALAILGKLKVPSGSACSILIDSGTPHGSRRSSLRIDNRQRLRGPGLLSCKILTHESRRERVVTATPTSLLSQSAMAQCPSLNLPEIAVSCFGFRSLGDKNSKRRGD
jgi:hypothetical protein